MTRDHQAHAHYLFRVQRQFALPIPFGESKYLVRAREFDRDGISLCERCRCSTPGRACRCRGPRSSSGSNLAPSWRYNPNTFSKIGELLLKPRVKTRGWSSTVSTISPPKLHTTATHWPAAVAANLVLPAVETSGPPTELCGLHSSAL